MKHFLFVLALLAAFSAFAQEIDESEVPQPVLDAVSNDFADYKIKDWELYEGEYQARTRVDRTTAYICFTAEGRYTKTIFPVDPRELPTAILDYVNENFTDVNFQISELVERADGNEVYFIELRKVGVAQGKLSELKFDPMGELIHRKDFQIVEKPEVAQRESKPRKEKPKKEIEEEGFEEETPAFPESLVPEKVKTNFNRRFRYAEDLVWDTMAANYVASFFVNDLRKEVHFTKEGEWLMSKEELEEDRVYRPVLRYIDEEYSDGYRFEYAEKISKNDRTGSYYVELSQRVRGMDEDPITKLYFDKMGRITDAEEPVLALEEEYDPEEDLRDPDFEELLDEDLEELKEAPVENNAVPVSELPSNIPEYIFGKYPDEIKIKESVIDQDKEWGTVYRILISKEGVGQESFNLYFDRRGDLLQDNVPENFYKPKTRGGNDEDVYYEDRTTLPSVDVPAEVKDYFSRRFPRAEEVEWEIIDDYYVSHFYYREMRYHTTFDKEAELLETRSEQSLDRIVRGIEDYVYENYPKYKIDYMEKALRKDRQHYYYVELFTRKKDLPEMVYLYFDFRGQLLDDAPPFEGQ